VLNFLPTFGDVFEIRVTLADIEPPIWRRLHVPAETSLAALHQVLQLALGWKDSHLHDFLVGEIRFCTPSPDDEIFSVDERGAPLGAVASVGSSFLYHYDFGDDWVHAIEVERIGRGVDRTLRCIDGARACPPEDCGGPPGYAHLLDVLANPKHAEYRDLKRWIGRSHDAEKLDLGAINKKLATLSKQLARARR
jgi:hypothetical protein